MNPQGTYLHEFDPQLVIELLKKEKICDHEAKQILDNACQVIMGLKKDLGDLLVILDGQVKTRQYWITGKVDA